MLKNISKSLDEIIFKIKSEKKTPIIFLLIGSCPDFSYIQQTPPVILEYIKNPEISPIVFIIDQIYKNETKQHTLSFLDLKITDFTQFQPGKWYYPDFIPSLKNSYQQRVAYQFYPQCIKIEEIFEFMQLSSVIDTMTLIWSFTGLAINPPFSINNNKMLIPDGNCLANTKYDSIYFPKLAIHNNEYVLINMENNFEEITSDFVIALSEKNEEQKNKKLNQLYGFVYYSLKKINEEMPGLRSWEIQLRTRDPEWKISFNKNSTQTEWDHFKMRARYFYNIDKLYTQFMNSKYYTLKDYINSSIYDIGNELIKINMLTDKNAKNESEQVEDFITNYQHLIIEDIRGLPIIFNHMFEKIKNKCQNIVEYDH
jgi:hypothetical protein